MSGLCVLSVRTVLPSGDVKRGKITMCVCDSFVIRGVLCARAFATRGVACAVHTLMCARSVCRVCMRRVFPSRVSRRHAGAAHVLFCFRPGNRLPPARVPYRIAWTMIM